MARVKKDKYNKSVFTNDVIKAFTKHCTDTGKEANACNMLEFLIEKSYVSDAIVNRYAALSEYKRLISINQNLRGRTVVEVSALTGIGETRIYHFLKHYWATYIRPQK